jgi:hypothetical protein
METIRVPKPAPEAFHKHRLVSDLVLSQVAHFQHVAEKKGLKIDPEVARDVQTEGGAARFIAAVTQALHQAASTAKGKVVPMKRGRGAVSESAGGTVRRIAAEAATPKGAKAASGTASKRNEAAKKSVKKAAKKAAKKTGAAAARTSSTGRKSSTASKSKTAKTSAKAKPQRRKR